MNDVLDVIRNANRMLAEEVAQATGANAPGVKRAANVLKNEIKKTLSVYGTGARFSLSPRRAYAGSPSAPGAPPHAQSGSLEKSVVSEAVDGTRHVGPADFRANWLQYGLIVNTATPKNGGRSRKAGARSKVLAPRPFMERSLERAIPKMTDEIADALSDPTRNAGVSA